MAEDIKHNTRISGFALDDDLLKNPQEGNDYFEGLTRRIQDIRTSERRFYQKSPKSAPPASITRVVLGLSGRQQAARSPRGCAQAAVRPDFRGSPLDRARDVERLRTGEITSEDWRTSGGSSSFAIFPKTARIFLRRQRSAG